MSKFIAVIQHEYRKVVMTWAFVIGTLLAPLFGASVTIGPSLILSLRSSATRLVVVDKSKSVGRRLKEDLAPDEVAAATQISAIDSAKEPRFKFVDFDQDNKPDEEIRVELNTMAADGRIDAYLIIPRDIEAVDSKYQFRSRKAGDFMASVITEALTKAVRSQRLANSGISDARLRELDKNIDLDAKLINEKGEEKESDMLFASSLAVALMLLISLLIYGQVIMGAVVEEKETRIAEILFSSARPFELMFGKLVGVGLAGLTQVTIWLICLTALVGFLSTQAGAFPITFSSLHFTPLTIIYFLVFFLLGYFVFASIFTLIGSVVSTVQEGGQFAFVPIVMMMIGFYFIFPVIRDPNSNLSFWISISPIFSSMTMPVRILAEMPPFWQIVLSIVLNLLTIYALVWLASRIYRVGLLMYGKRATIPEIWRWVRET